MPVTQNLPVTLLQCPYNPSETYQVCDTMWPQSFMMADLRHMGRHNMLWMDGHVKLTAQNLS